MFWRLDTLDGDFVILRSPSLLSASLINQYHIALLTEIQEKGIIFPIDYEQEIAQFAHFEKYYQKIAALLIQDTGIEFECDRLTPTSRHKFFICSDPHEHPETGEMVLGLSGLSQLLGHRYGKEGEPPEYTTGESELDILVDCLLVFKGRGMTVARSFSGEEISRMVIQANHRMTPPDEKNEKTKLNSGSRAKASIDDSKAKDLPIFQEHQEDITSRLHLLNVILPEGW